MRDVMEEIKDLAEGWVRNHAWGDPTEREIHLGPEEWEDLFEGDEPKGSCHYICRDWTFRIVSSKEPGIRLVEK